jgi:hypothetical protein
MSDNSQTPFVNRASGAAVAFLLVSALLVGLGLVARFCITAPPIDADHAADRYKALADMHAAEDTSLSSSAWVDQDRKIVRLPIDVAMQITAQEWQDPAKTRADLIARGVKATAPLPKVAPKPSAFE